MLPELSRRGRRAALAVAMVATACVALLLVAAPVVALGVFTPAADSDVDAPAPVLAQEPAEPVAPIQSVRAATAPQPAPEDGHPGDVDEKVRRHDSRALGLPYEGGRLVRGVRVPPQGRHFFTWDPIQRNIPNRGWRRWGHDRLVRLTLRVIREYRRAHPRAPRVGIGDLSRPEGGPFGPQYGGIGHASHRSGLDVDIYYPRHDRAERAPRRVGQVDLRLAQDLVDRFVRAGARYVFVGPNVSLTGPSGVVQPVEHHDNHLHVRIPDPD